MNMATYYILLTTGLANRTTRLAKHTICSQFNKTVLSLNTSRHVRNSSKNYIVWF